MRILVDTNVIIAAFVREHQHNMASDKLLNEPSTTPVIAAHSLSEAFNQLTRPERVFVRLQPLAVTTLLKTLSRQFAVRTLTTDELLESIGAFAALGGRGARLYDYLIGHVGVLERVDAIATWNVRHFAPLFPQLRVATPEKLLEA